MSKAAANSDTTQVVLYRIRNAKFGLDGHAPNATTSLYLFSWPIHDTCIIPQTVDAKFAIWLKNTCQLFTIITIATSQTCFHIQR